MKYLGMTKKQHQEAIRDADHRDRVEKDLITSLRMRSTSESDEEKKELDTRIDILVGYLRRTDEELENWDTPAIKPNPLTG